MPAVVKSVGAKATGSTGCTVNAPAGIAPGDLELLFVETLYPNSFSAAGGWTAIISSGAPVYAATGGYDSDQSTAPHLAVYRRVAPADCANSIAITAATDHVVAFRLAITGASKSAPVHKTSTRANTGTISFPFFSNVSITVPKGLVFCVIGYGYDSNTTYTATADGQIGYGTDVVLEEALVFAGGTGTGGGGGLIVTSGQVQKTGNVFDTYYEKLQLVEDNLPTDTNCICSVIVINEYTNVLAFPSASSMAASGAKGGQAPNLVARGTISQDVSLTGEHPHDRLATMVMQAVLSGDVFRDKAVSAQVEPFASSLLLTQRGVALEGANQLVFAGGFGGDVSRKKGVQVGLSLPVVATTATTIETVVEEPEVAGPIILNASIDSRNGPIPPENYLPGDTYLWYGGTELDWDWHQSGNILYVGDIRVVVAFIAPNYGYLNNDFSYSSGGFYDQGPMYHTLVSSSVYSLRGDGPDNVFLKVFTFKVTQANLAAVLDWDIDMYLRAYDYLPQHGWCTAIAYTIRGADYANPIDQSKLLVSTSADVFNEIKVKNLNIAKKNNLIIFAAVTSSGDPVTFDPNNVIFSQSGGYNASELISTHGPGARGIFYALRAKQAGLFFEGAAEDEPVHIATNANQRIQCGIAISVNGVVPVVGHTEAHLSLALSTSLSAMRTAGRDIAHSSVSWITATTEKTFEPVYSAHLTEASTMAVQAEKSVETNIDVGPRIYLGAWPSKDTTAIIEQLARVRVLMVTDPARDDGAVLPVKFSASILAFAHREVPLERSVVLEWKVVASKGASNGVHLEASSCAVATSKELSLTATLCYTAVKQDPALQINSSK